MGTIKYFSLLLIFVTSLTSCEELFKPTVADTVVVEKSIKWTNKDKFPSFPECENGFDIQNCFKKAFTSKVKEALTLEGIVFDMPVDNETALVTIEVDTKGRITMLDAQISRGLNEAVPKMKVHIDNAIRTLPNAIPALKSNVKTPVSVTFQVPIRITTEESSSL